MRGASQTARMVAAYRARASGRDVPICDDRWAGALAGEEGQAIARRYDVAFPHMELWVGVRTAFFDQCIRRSIDGGMRQVVILGAGFDTRAARLAQAETRFFEVDQPDTQASKLAGLSLLEGYPVTAATYVACDFERDDFLTRLVASGFDAARPAFFLWEGVTAYLTEAAVRATLRRIAEGTDAASVVAFDHVLRRLASGDVRPKDLESREFVADLGEPIRFGVDYPLPLLYEEGFRRVRTLTFDEACLDITGLYDREHQFRFQGIALATRAAPVLP